MGVNRISLFICFRTKKSIQTKNKCEKNKIKRERQRKKKGRERGLKWLNRLGRDDLGRRMSRQWPVIVVIDGVYQARQAGTTGRREDGDKGLGWFTPLIALAMLRYRSATSNIIHDCDEVFNYWEPLHFLLYKSGFQTWEYR